VRAGLMSTTGRKDFLRLLLVTALTLVSACDSGRKRINVLTAHGEAEVTLMDFSTPFPLDPPPGCSFHPRCPFADARCREERPLLRAAGPGLAACHAVEEGRI